MISGQRIGVYLFMSTYPAPQLTPQPPPAANRTGFVIAVSVLSAMLVLLGVALMWFAVQNGFAFAPTPTPTATVRPAMTPTPDLRATHVAEDMHTQVAFAATLVAGMTAGAPLPVDLPANSETAQAQATGGVKLPMVVAPGILEPEQTPAQLAPDTPVSTVVYMPNVENPGPPTPTPPPPPTPLPPPPPTILVPPTPVFTTPALPTQAFPTPVLPTQVFPTPPPVLPTPVPTIPLPIGGELAATLRSADTAVRVGPSNTYTVSASIAANTVLRLRGRTPAGDWVYACCIPNTATTFWVRSAYVTIGNNTLPPGAPSDADPNNASWLAVQPPDPALIPRPTPTGIPVGDFPLAHYDSQNSGRVPSLPNAPLQQSWFNLPQAGLGFVSPVAVSGASVLASNADNQFYSLDLNAGSQRWRYDLQNSTQWAPSIQDGLIYLSYAGRSVAALQDQGNAAGLIWQSDLPQNATSPFNIWLDTLFIGAGESGEARLVAVRRNNPAERREFAEPNARVLQPAIGQETIFVGADRLWALDANLLSVGQEIVWTSSDVFNVGAPPVYAWPGVVKLAELYVADSNGTVHAIDANTGVRIWTHSPGWVVTALAVNDGSVILAGSNGVMRAISRRDGSAQWTQTVGGPVMGGPIVTNTRALAVTQNGGIFLLDATNGGILDAAQNVQSQVPGGPAVSGLQVLVPTSNNSVYAFRGAP
jgi:outer membrane protein assembly factor BamB